MSSQVALKIDLYASADNYGKGSLGRAMDVAKLLDASYDGGGLNQPFTIFVDSDKKDIAIDLIKDAGLILIT